MTTPTSPSASDALQKARELAEEATKLGGKLPWCEDCVYGACRHVSRNVDRDAYSDCTHDGQMFGYDGGFIARVCNAFPSIHAELEKVTAERDQWKQMYADLSEVHKCHNCDYEYIQTKKYKSFQYRQGKLILNSTERILMEILMKFGESVDSQGYDGGDYDTAMKLLLFLYETHAVDCPNYKS